ncbi:MAG: protein translocase subunit SecF [Pseudomonadales bacterium]
MTNIRFMAWRNVALITSLTLVLASVVLLAWRGLNFGLDFTGGTLVEIGFQAPVDPEAVRRHLDASGVREAVVQQFGTDRELLVRVPPQRDTEQSKLGDQVFERVAAEFDGATLRQSSFVGPAVGEELAEDGGLALLASVAVILIYILFRFAKQFAFGAVIALVHDVLITLGFFAAFQWTFDLPALAAVLAVIGYSLNDTIVVADRIRENVRRIRKGTIPEIIDLSLNQTLDRTLSTSGTTLFVLVALLIFGGESVRGFADALTIGIVVGTYSSIYVAAALLILMNIRREDLVVVEKEQEQQDSEYP